MDMGLFVLMVFILPAWVADKMAKYEGMAVTILCLALPFAIIHLVAMNADLLTSDQTPPVSTGAPMGSVVYILYGIPSAILNLSIRLLVRKHNKR